MLRHGLLCTQMTFVGPGFTRKPPKYERFIRPTGLRITKAHVTHPELKATFCLEIIGIKKNPNGQVGSSSAWATKATEAGGQAAAHKQRGDSSNAAQHGVYA